MKRSIVLLLSVVLLLAAPNLFAQLELPEPVADVLLHPAPSAELAAAFAEAPADASYLWDLDPGAPALILDFTPIASLVQAAASDAASAAATEVPTGLLDNEYYRESLRFKNLAQEAFEYGDYDASANYAAEATRNAQLSDDYIALMLKKKAVDDAIAAAGDKLDWAASIGADKTYPDQYGAGKGAYDAALGARDAEAWDDALAAARRVLDLLAELTELAPLPARYTVRPWATARDCFWNIAGYPFVYGDPTKWKLLYEANKTRLRRPENPDLLHVGIVLNIPSIRNEVRDGSWVSGRAYAPLPKRK